MNANRNLTEDLAALASLAPQSVAVGTVFTTACSISQFRRLLGELHLGALGAAGVVNSQWYASATSGGAYVAVPGTAVTAVSAGAENVVRNELKCDGAAQALGPYFKLGVTVTGNAVQAAAIVYGGVSRYGAASDQNEAAVTQTLVN